MAELYTHENRRSESGELVITSSTYNTDEEAIMQAQDDIRTNHRTVVRIVTNNDKEITLKEIKKLDNLDPLALETH